MKKQKLIERQEEDVKLQMAQTMRAPYMNHKSKIMLEKRGSSRLNSAQKMSHGAVNSNTASQEGFDKMLKNHGASVMSTANKRLSNTSSQQLTFHPEITRMSQNLKRDRPV